MRKMIAAMGLVACLYLPTSLTARTPETRAADKIEIQELGARFDNALDAEDVEKFVAVFTADGVLEGFWGKSEGREGIAQAHAFMLQTFAKDKRHVVTNHEISVTGTRANMFSYLTVFDRKNLSVTGTATFTDELVRVGNEWKFTKRTLKADPNVDAIIKSIALPRP